MGNPKLSIVIPVTNMAGRFENFRRTLFTVDWAKCEVLLIHDVRDELTGVELEEVKSMYARHPISLYEGQFGSPGAARNFGLEKAIGEWIIFWDSDDSGYAQNVLSEISENEDVGMVIGSYQVTDLSERISWKIKSPSRITGIAFNPGLWRVVFRKKSIQHVRFSEYLMGEDQIFLAKCFTLGLTYKFSDALFYDYFKSVPNQLTKNASAVDQLKKATNDAIYLLNKQNGDLEKFLLVMIFRQTLTNLKRNFRRDFRPTCFMLFEIFIPRPAKFIGALFQCIGESIASKTSIEVVS